MVKSTLQRYQDGNSFNYDFYKITPLK